MNRKILITLHSFRSRLIGKVGTSNRPHSPLFTAKHGLDDRKSKIFDLKPDVTGRKAKLFLTFCSVSLLWAVFKMLHRHELVR